VRLRYAVPAGLLDAGFASLASMATSLFAARFLSAPELGAYALYFSAFILAAVVPTQLLLIPAEIATITSVASARNRRIGLMQQSLHIGGVGAVAAGLVASAIAYASARAPHDVLWALAISATACAVVSPLQDHVRRTLHLAGASWRAATVSVVQLLCAVAALASLRALGVGTAWCPFGALALANTLSLATAFALTRHERRISSLQRYNLSGLMRSGRWLLLLEAIPTVGIFLSYALITQLAGSAAVGYAEAARIASQPIFVLTVGLSAVLGPRSAEAAVARDHDRAKRIARSFGAILVVLSLAYGAVTAVPWTANPLGVVIPKAYVVPGLVAASVLAYLIGGLVFPYRAELVGSGRLAPLPPVALLAGGLQCVATLAALWISGFARPLGSAIAGLVLMVGYGWYRRSLYGHAPAPARQASGEQVARPGSETR
jgi:O-antigen/teichoic acid export membrane protein